MYESVSGSWGLGQSAAKLRNLIFYGYSGAAGDGTKERDGSMLYVARTLQEHILKRFPSDDVELHCTWHKNAFVKALAAKSALQIRQIHYCGHGFGGGLSFGYKNKQAMDERGTLAATLAASSASEPEKRKKALEREHTLISGYFRDALAASVLGDIKLLPDTLMHIWGCFASAPDYTFDTGDAYWGRFNGGGASVDGIAKDIAKSLAIHVTAVRDPASIHGMNFWIRKSGKIEQTKSKGWSPPLPRWLWPASKKVIWVTYDSTGAAGEKDLHFLGETRTQKELATVGPPAWFTKEIPLAFAKKKATVPSTCSPAYVAV